MTIYNVKTISSDINFEYSPDTGVSYLQSGRNTAGNIDHKPVLHTVCMVETELNALYEYLVNLACVGCGTIHRPTSPCRCCTQSALTPGRHSTRCNRYADTHMICTACKAGDHEGCRDGSRPLGTNYTCVCMMGRQGHGLVT